MSAARHHHPGADQGPGVRSPAREVTRLTYGTTAINNKLLWCTGVGVTGKGVGERGVFAMGEANVRNHLPDLLRRLRETYPDARYELDWETPLQLVVATILAAQCTDERVNAVTPALFAKYRDARAFASADLAELEEDVRPTGFYRNKAKAIRDACRALVDRFGGEVPADIEELITLPGVARKTANVVLNNAFRIPSGVIVDTHVARVSQRLGLTDETKPEQIEADLMHLLPRDEWIPFGAGGRAPRPVHLHGPGPAMLPMCPGGPLRQARGHRRPGRTNAGRVLPLASVRPRNHPARLRIRR